MTSTLETLIAARKLIEKPENWTSGWFARDARGRKTEASNKSAVCFCAIGAISKVECAVSDGWANEGAAATLLFQATGQHVAGFNDSHTHTEVLAAFDRAIELAKE